MVMVVCYGVELAHHHVAHDERSMLKSRMFFAHEIFPDFELGVRPSKSEGNGPTKAFFVAYGLGVAPEAVFGPVAA